MTDEEARRERQQEYLVFALNGHLSQVMPQPDVGDTSSLIHGRRFSGKMFESIPQVKQLRKRGLQAIAFRLDSRGRFEEVVMSHKLETEIMDY